MEQLTRDELLDLLNEYDEYIQNANDVNRYRDGWFPVCIREFLNNEYQLILQERKQPVKESALELPVGAFAYGGYHFVPYRQFRKGEIEKHLENDSRKWKMDARYAMRNMHSDFELGLSKYNWRKADYNYKAFYAASDGSGSDIFRCIENGELYVPTENELFRYSEPPNFRTQECGTK